MRVDLTQALRPRIGTVAGAVFLLAWAVLLFLALDVPRLMGRSFVGLVSLIVLGLSVVVLGSRIFRLERARVERDRLASVVDSADDAVISADLEGTVRSWNRAAERIYGIRATEMIGQSLRRTVPPDKVDEFERVMSELRQGRAVLLPRTERLDRKGERIPLSLALSPVFENGRVVGASAIGRDRSAEVAAENAVLESEARHRQLAEELGRSRDVEWRLRNDLERAMEASRTVSEAVADLARQDVNDVLRTVAEQARRLTSAKYVALGIGTDETVPFSPWIVLGVSSEEEHRIGRHPRPVGLLGAVARGGKVIRTRDLHTDPRFGGFPAHHPPMGSFLGVPIRFRGKPVGNLYLANKETALEFSEQDERIIGTLGAAAGAAIETANVYKQEALHRAWLQAIIEQMPDGVRICDEKGNVVVASRVAAAVSAPDSFSVRYLDSEGEPVPPEAQPMARALRDDGASTLQELTIELPDGDAMSVLVGATPVKIDGRIAGAVEVFQDVRLLKEFQRLQREWTSVVAHDLRQPLGVISLSLQRLERDVAAGNPAHISSLDRIRRSAETLTRMVEDLLDASLVEAKRLDLSRSAASLEELVREVREAMPELEGRTVELEVNPRTPLVSCDRGRVEQILRNLLSNAVKYGAPGGPISISIRPGGHGAVVGVTNRGPGLRPEEAQGLFKRFGRSDASRQQGTSGIGLGLYISKGLVEAHGGRIWIESTPGESTTFFFDLPAEAHAGAAAESLPH